MMKFINIFMLFAVCALSVAGNAEDITTPVLSAEFFLEQSLDTNPQVEILSSVIREKEAYLVDLASSDESRVDCNLRTNPISGGESDNDPPIYFGELSYHQHLPFSYPLKKLRAEIMVEQSEILSLQARSEQIKRYLQRRIMQNYARYASHFEKVNLDTQAVKILEEKRDVLQSLVDSNEGLREDLMKVEADIEHWKGRKREHENLMRGFHSDIVYDTGVDVPLFVPVPPPALQHGTMLLPPYEDLKSRIIRNSPEIAALAYQESAYRSAADLHGALPIESSFFVRAYAQNDDVGDNYGMGAGLRISFPLKGRSRAQSRKKQYKERSAQFHSNSVLKAEELEHKTKLTYYEILQRQQTLFAAQKRVEWEDEQLRVRELRDRLLPDEIEVVPPGYIYDVRLERVETMLDLCDAQQTLSNSVYGLGELTSLDALPTEKTKLDTLDRGLWVWGDTIVSSDEEQQAFMDVVKFLNIKRVYLGFSKSLREKMLAHKTDIAADLIYLLHRNDIKAELLLGEHSWIFPEHRQELIEIVEQWLAYQQKLPATHQWDGLHLDIEPHASALREEGESWDDVKARYLDEYVATIKKVWETIQPVRRAQPKELRSAFSLYLDIPPWWNKESVNDESLVRQVLEYSDGLVLMNYSTNPDIRLAGPQQILAEASILGKQVWIGNESNLFGDAFSSELSAAWEKESERVYESFGIYPSLEGFALHHYASLRQE
jgi:outer membrane protein TolC